MSVEKQSIRRSLNAYADGIKYPRHIKDSIRDKINLDKALEVWHFYKEMDANKVPKKERNKLINRYYKKESNKFFTNGVEFARQFKDWYVMSGKSKGKTTIALNAFLEAMAYYVDFSGQCSEYDYRDY